jgi:ApaG protein
MNAANTPEIDIKVEVTHVAEQSDPEANRYAFAYTITISNQGQEAARLLRRHWVITDSNGKVQEVHGEGVVGEQPHIQPGEYFQYTSGAVIETPVGTMEGEYEMVTDDGREFIAPIPRFTLSIPRTLH